MVLSDDKVISSSSGSHVDSPWEEVWNDRDSPMGVDISEISNESTLTGYVRYARYDSGEFTQNHFLAPASSPIPDNARWVSPAIYFLTSNEEEDLRESESPRKIQERCETAGRVAYAVLAESDALEDGYEVSTVVGWLVEFAEEQLGLCEADYRLYYSGNRSIHLQTTKFVPGEEGRKWLKRQAEAFTDETDAELDAGIHQPKGQFRLSGVKHRKTDLYKVDITPLLDGDHTVSREEVVPRATSPLDEKEWPFPDIQSIDNTSIHYCPGDSDIEPLPDEIGKWVLEEYLKDKRGTEAENTTTSSQSRKTLSAPFSPYAKAGRGNGRSVCLVEQTGDVIERDGTHYVEAHIRQATGADGTFRRYNYEGFVKLSPRDTHKWEFSEADVVVIIGGRSGSSRLLDLTDNERLAALVELDLWQRGRAEALQTLENHGYEVGEAGYNGEYEPSDGEPDSDAARIKREIDSGRREPDYDDVFRVSCRLLRLYGWGRTWQWIEQTLENEFDPSRTHERLATIVGCYFDGIDPPIR
jgi:hypothetical protein